MKTAYATPSFTNLGKSSRHQPPIWDNEVSQAQGPEAGQVLAQRQEAVYRWNQQATVLIFHIEKSEDFSYNHVPPKRVFSVKTQYKHVGKMKPRQFPLDA
jgi:hypothetical protein